MKTLLENITSRLLEVWHTLDMLRRNHTHRCECGNMIFFRNSQCFPCGVLPAYESDLPEMIAALNELAGSRGHQDFYPFVISRPVLCKLHFIQLVANNERETAASG